jgi:hypothetical protein
MRNDSHADTTQRLIFLGGNDLHTIARASL